jgi:hypothetical protein
MTEQYEDNEEIIEQAEGAEEGASEEQAQEEEGIEIRGEFVTKSQIEGLIDEYALLDRQFKNFTNATDEARHLINEFGKDQFISAYIHFKKKGHDPADILEVIRDYAHKQKSGQQIDPTEDMGEKEKLEYYAKQAEERAYQRVKQEQEQAQYITRTQETNASLMGEALASLGYTWEDVLKNPSYGKALDEAAIDIGGGKDFTRTPLSARQALAIVAASGLKPKTHNGRANPTLAKAPRTIVSGTAGARSQSNKTKQPLSDSHYADEASRVMNML